MPQQKIPTLTAPESGGDPAAGLDERTRQFYLDSMAVLDRAGVPYLVGGAYALAHYTGIIRHTKDLDLFVRQTDLDAAFKAYQAAGYRTELTHPHWIGKAISGDAPAADPSKGPDAFIDLIYGSGNGMSPVDDGWIEHSVDGIVLGRTARLVPAEEMIWSKAFILERERFDGADVAHLILQRGDQLNWPRLLQRFAGHERVLLAQLILFGYAYPSQRQRVPADVMQHLLGQLDADPLVAPNGRPVCYGTLLSWSQYLPDVHHGGYADGRLKPWGNLKPNQVAQWTNADK
jgi:hypothetical protein